MPIENFVRGSDNQIKLTLTEDGVPVAGAYTGLDIWIGSVNIHRDDNGEGVNLNAVTGLLTLTPADMEADEILALAELSPRRSYRVRIVVTSAITDDGAVFGGDGSEKIVFILSDKPA